MIISRDEFHNRVDCFEHMKVEKEVKEFMSVKDLYKEIQLDAPYRNHQYMFKKGVDFSKLALQEESIGIKKKFPDIKTEQERFDKIEDEILYDTFESIPVMRDIDYPSVFYVENGFHRIFLAYKLGLKKIRVKSKYGKFNLDKSIDMKDLSVLLKMVHDLMGKKYPTLIGASEVLQNAKNKKIRISYWTVFTKGA